MGAIGRSDRERAVASSIVPPTSLEASLKSIMSGSVAGFIVPVALMALCLAGCANGTKVDVMLDATASVRAKPTVVYVMDFDLDADKIKLDPRRVAAERRAVGSFLKDVKHSLGLSKTPQEEARELIDLMAKSITEGLGKAGVEAHRVAANAPLAKDGWLVRGTFLQVDEGDRLRRAIGGSGGTDIQVAVTVYDLAGNPNTGRLLQLDTDAKSAKSSHTMSISPYSIALKYVLAGYDLDRNAKQTGAKIAEEVAKRVRGVEPVARAPAPPR
jgi:hypothetical protein